MPEQILIGQVWQKLESGENFLVTRIYKELFSTYALLRKVGDEGSGGVRVRVDKSGEGAWLPGFVFTQEQQ